MIFKLDMNADTEGTSLLTLIDVSDAKMTEVFGTGEDITDAGSGYEASYTFSGPSRQTVFTVYKRDGKWRIGGMVPSEKRVPAFKRWLAEKGVLS